MRQGSTRIRIFRKKIKNFVTPDEIQPLPDHLFHIFLVRLQEADFSAQPGINDIKAVALLEQFRASTLYLISFAITLYFIFVHKLIPGVPHFKGIFRGNVKISRS